MIYIYKFHRCRVTNEPCDRSQKECPNGAGTILPWCKYFYTEKKENYEERIIGDNHVRS